MGIPDLADSKLTELTEFVAEDIELDPWPAFADDDILGGDPAHRGKVLYRDPTKRLSFGIWECPVGVFREVYDPFGEMIHCIQGEAIVTNEHTGVAVHLTPGSRMIAPVGLTAIWDVKETFKKVYAGFEESWDESRYY